MANCAATLVPLVTRPKSTPAKLAQMNLNKTLSSGGLLLVLACSLAAADSATLAIEQIHGEGRNSALAGQVVTTEGTVTLVQRHGFWIQSNAGDSPGGRHGLYVRTGDLPEVARGDSVRVTAQVENWRDEARPDDLTLVRLVAVDLDRLATDQRLPEPVVIGPGGLVIPRSIGPIEEGQPLAPDSNAIDFWTRLTGMRVSLVDNQVIEPTNRFHQTWVVADRGHRHLNPYGVLVIGPDDDNADRVLVQANEFLLPAAADPADIGDRFDRVTGVVHYERGNFRIIAEHGLERIRGEQRPGQANLQASPDHLLVASYNIENINAWIESPARVASLSSIDDALGSGRMNRLGVQIAQALNSPDIIALQEIQDDDGAELSDVVSAERTLAALAAAVRRAGGPAYVWRDHPPVAPGANGGQPGGNIRNAWLYNPERVELLDESVQILDDAAFTGSRPATLAVFRFNGHDLTLVNNHLSSKWGSGPTFGRQPRREAGAEERQAQARFLRRLTIDRMAGGDRLVIVLGDFNDHWYSEPLAVLTVDETPRLFNLVETLPMDRRWTLIFEGNGQAIDHMLVSEDLRPRARFEIVYLNERFARQDSDHEPLLGQFFLPAASANNGSSSSGE